MSEQPRLVTNNEEVIKNIKHFTHELGLYLNGDCDKSITLLVENISHYRAWYAYWDEEENKYLFAPSKYIGYQNMDAKQYAELNRSYLDGRKTEIVLANWYQTLDENDESYEELRLKLSDYCWDYSKSLNSLFRINVLKQEDDKGILEKDLVDLIYKVFLSLSNENKDIVRRKIVN